ncbi:MAG: hypothetical protein Q7S22_05385 [Candidatus Micrarchaeota archaeon]|nr:hypothetical protein [Candidatus Micrarchaeota archaeon]
MLIFQLRSSDQQKGEKAPPSTKRTPENIKHAVGSDCSDGTGWVIANSDNSKINEKNFIKELINSFPEFKQIYENNKEDCDIGVNIVFGYFRRFCEDAITKKDTELTKRIAQFILRCQEESKDEVQNAVFVSFFENMDNKYLLILVDFFPKEFTSEIFQFLEKFDKATS